MASSRASSGNNGSRNSGDTAGRRAVEQVQRLLEPTADRSPRDF